MKTYTISDADGRGFTRMFSGGDVEYVDPLKYYSELFTNLYATNIRDFLFMKDTNRACLISNEWFTKKGNEKWLKDYEEVKSTQIPEAFIMLLNTKKKKEQISMLKGQSLTREQLMAFILTAWSDFGFYFSQYSAEHHHKGLENEVLPKFVHVEGAVVNKIGGTTLTDGQLKNLVEHRMGTISKFLDNGPNWHCFYITYKSLRGKESWKNGQAHYHYISDKFGVPRDELVRRLKSDDIPSSSVHIDLIGYGN